MASSWFHYNISRSVLHVYISVLDRVIRSWFVPPLALDRLLWLWFAGLTSSLRHPGVSHQLRKKEFTAHLNLSIRGAALFPLLRFQLTAAADEPRTRSPVSWDLEFVGASEGNPRLTKELSFVEICWLVNDALWCFRCTDFLPDFFLQWKVPLMVRSHGTDHTAALGIRLTFNRPHTKELYLWREG